jgi:hypothetical protein
MRTFSCQVCGQPVYFENTQCNHCGATLGFLPDKLALSALQQGDDGLWRVPVIQSASLAPPPASKGRFGGWFGARSARPVGAAPPPEPGRAYRKCANYEQHDVCNWMVPADTDEAFCAACRPNQVIPNLARPGNLDKWFRIERSKRRLAYSLLRLGLPVRTKAEDPEGGLAFAFLSSQDATPEPVMTGHASGLITINIDEADAAARERMRVDMDEQYRTLLGHFRHEIGHYYWDLLIRDGGRLEDFRAVFGDEREDYATALNDHYANGAPPDWEDRFVSAYAASHPWEDWSETWAHYLHIVDTLETSAHFGVRIERRLPDGSVQRSDPDFDPYTIDDFEPIAENWLPLTFALNSLSRSMGQPDMYPFVLSQTMIEKLGFVHRVVRESRVRD